MTNYHLTEKGPAVCTARVRACPLGGSHYDTIEDARKGYEMEIKRNAPVNVGLPQISFSGTVKPMKWGSYFGASVNGELLYQHIEAWGKLVGEKRAKLEENKEQRDGGVAFHITTVRPHELKRIPKPLRDELKGELSKDFKNFSFLLKGVGVARNDEGETWFIVVQSQDIQDWRKSLGLAEIDLHITIGFDPKDIHDVSKGADTLQLV